jgi:hypothetical protein
MWLILLIFHLVIFIFILIILCWICKKTTRIIETEAPKNPFTIKLNKINERLEKMNLCIKP